MPRTCVLSLVILLVIVGTGLAVAQNPATAAELTASQILARNAESRGGLAAWRAVQSMAMSGRVEAGKGVDLPFRLELKRPRKMRLELDFKEETAVQIFDGAAGWKLRPFLGRRQTEAMSPEEPAFTFARPPTTPSSPPCPSSAAACLKTVRPASARIWPG